MQTEEQFACKEVCNFVIFFPVKQTMQKPSSERERLLSGAEPMGLKSGVKVS